MPENNVVMAIVAMVMVVVHVMVYLTLVEMHDLAHNFDSVEAIVSTSVIEEVAA